MGVLRLWLMPMFIVTCIATSGCSYGQWGDIKNLPFAVTARVELASAGWPLKRSSLSLVCGSDKSLRLIMLTEVPGRRETFSVDFPDEASIFINGIDQQIPDVVMRAVIIGPPDAIVSDALSISAVEQLTEWFGAIPPNKVSVVGFWETGTYMQGKVTGADIDTIARSCHSS